MTSEQKSFLELICDEEAMLLVAYQFQVIEKYLVMNKLKGTTANICFVFA